MILRYTQDYYNLTAWFFECIALFHIKALLGLLNDEGVLWQRENIFSQAVAYRTLGISHLYMLKHVWLKNREV